MTKRFVLPRLTNGKRGSIPSHSRGSVQSLTMSFVKTLAALGRWPTLDTDESIEEYVLMNKSRGAS